MLLTKQQRSLVNKILKDGVVDRSEIIAIENIEDREAVLAEIEELHPLIESATDEEQKKMSIKKNRLPYSVFPDRLPTFGKMPLPIDEHSRIGLYESKQNLYLIIAHAYNKIMEKLEQLELADK